MGLIEVMVYNRVKYYESTYSVILFLLTIPEHVLLVSPHNRRAFVDVHPPSVL